MPAASLFSAPEDDPSSPTRALLLRTALPLIARHGIAALSLRKIGTEAGMKNTAAIQYHFTNKTGLVRALMDQIADRILPAQMANLDQLDGDIRAGKPVTPAQIIEAIHIPVIVMASSGAEGMYAVRFISRLSWEAGPAYQKMLLDTLAPPVVRAEPMLAERLVHVPRAPLQMRLMMSLTNVIHGTADTAFAAAFPLDGVGALMEDQALMLETYLRFVINGICGMQTSSLAPDRTSRT